MNTLPGTPDSVPLSLRGPAPTRVVVAFGFWLFLLSDIIIFGALFAAYAVLSHQTDGGPTGPELFDRGRVLLETGILLASSFTCGMAMLAANAKQRGTMIAWLLATFALGAAFLGIELAEFSEMVNQGAGPSRSAFLSSFFALVGTHGLHVFIGLLWIVLMIAQALTMGMHERVQNRLLCFALFWHALDIVWVGVFTIVYLGAHL